MFSLFLACHFTTQSPVVRYFVIPWKSSSSTQLPACSNSCPYTMPSNIHPLLPLFLSFLASALFPRVSSSIRRSVLEFRSCCLFRWSQTDFLRMDWLSPNTQESFSYHHKLKHTFSDFIVQLTST